MSQINTPKCTKCKSGIEIDAKFCTSCGHPTNSDVVAVNYCPYCKNEYSASYIHCEQDGHKLVPIVEPLPRCVICYKSYPKGTTVCPVDEGEVKLIPKRLKRNKHKNFSKEDGMFEYMFSFEGRITRTEYALTYGIYICFHFLLQILLGEIERDAKRIVILCLYIPAIWAFCAQTAKRCHDIGNSGWYQLIPFYGILLLFLEGEKVPNKYDRKQY